MNQKSGVQEDVPVRGTEALSDPLYSAGVRITVVGMVSNGVLTIAKLIAGILGGSVAMIADAFHSVSDFATDIGVLIGLAFLAKPADDNHPYGHGRLETVISFLMGLAIILTGLGIGRNAVLKIMGAFQGVYPAMPGSIALFAGILSIIVKEGLYHYTRIVAERTGSRTLKANAWHHRTDSLSSVGTVIGIGGAILLGDRWTVLDPVAAVIVSVMVIKVGYHIGYSALRELSDEALSREREKKLCTAIQTVQGVQNFHNLRTRSLGRSVSVDAHITVDPELTVRDGHDIATNVEDSVRGALGNVAFVNIHIEPGKVS